MNFDLGGSVALAAEPHLGIFGQELKNVRAIIMFRSSLVPFSLLLNQGLWKSWRIIFQIVHPPSCRGTWLPRRTCWSIPPPPPSPASPLLPSWSSFSFAERATGPRSSRTAGSPVPTSLGWMCSARFSPPLVLEDTRKRRIWSRKSPSQICASARFTHPYTRPSPPVLWWSVPLVREQLNPDLISWCGLKTQKNQQVDSATQSYTS